MMEFSSADDERRGHERIPRKMECEITINERKYTGITENISMSGICLRFLDGPSNNLKDFRPDSTLSVRCNISPREKVQVEAAVRWVLFHKDPSQGLFDFMGVELINTPAVYKNYIVGLR